MKRGFTLMELIIVIIIIGILVLVGLPRLIANLENARRAEALATLKSIQEVERAYYAANNNYKNTLPIQVDLDGDGTNEYDFQTPTSVNFTYTIPNSDQSSGYAQAARSGTAGGRQSYGMCLSSNKVATCPTEACNPGCPQ